MSDPILPLQSWPEGIAQASVPANDNALRLEAMSRPCLGTSNNPSTPTDGDVWIVGDTPTGVFASFDENDIALARVDEEDNVSWYAWAPVPGLRINMEDGSRKVYVGESTNEWVSAGGDVESIVAGDGIDIDVTDPANPVVSIEDTSVTPGSYTSADITVGADGRITAASNGSGGGGGSGAMTLVSSQTVSGSAVTDVTFSSLNLAADGRYQLEMSILNAVGSAPALSLFFNADTTASNYRSQIMTQTGSSISAGGNNNAIIFSIVASSYAFSLLDIKRDISGRPRTIGSVARDEPASYVRQDFAHIRANTANVTSLTISSSVASAIGIGSVFKLYKIG